MVMLSTRPLYLQLRDALVERIASGEWKPRAVIPSESDLAREFKVSPGTMRKALDLMEHEHLVTRRQGRGTFVNDQGSDELSIRFTNIRGADGGRITGQVKSAEISEAKADKAEADRLRVQMHDPVYRIRRVRFHQNQPLMVEEASMPAALFPGLAGNGTVSDRLVVLAQQYGLLLGTAEERISIGSATAGDADALGISQGASIMVLDRVVHTLDKRPIEWRVGRCHLAKDYYMAEMC